MLIMIYLLHAPSSSMSSFDACKTCFPGDSLMFMVAFCRQ